MNRRRTMAALAVAAMTMGALLARAADSDSHVSDSRYLGAESCARCHPEAYAVWQRTAHARALEALEGRDREDPNCLQCHTAVPGSPNPTLMGVQCETCHGQGRYYSSSHVMRDAELREALGFKNAGTETCARCHTDSTPSISAFDPAHKLELIRHTTSDSSKPTP